MSLPTKVVAKSGGNNCPNSGKAEIIDKACALSDAVKSGMDETWDNVINSRLFAYINKWGVLLGFFGILVWANKHLPETIDRGLHYGQAKKLLGPIAIVILFGHPSDYGSLFGDSILMARTVVYGINNEILLLVYNDVSQERAILNEANAKIAATLIVSQAIAICSELQDKNQVTDCFLLAQDQLRKTLSPFFNPAISPIKNWARSLFVKESERLSLASLAASRSGTRMFFRAPQYELNQLLDQTGIAAQLATGTTFLYALEIVGILTAVLGGLSLGMSLFPASKPAILIWLGAMVGIWMTHLSYSLIVTIAAIFYLNSPLSTAVVLFGNLVGFFGPIMAVLIGGGGGLATVVSLGALTNTIIPKK